MTREEAIKFLLEDGTSPDLRALKEKIDELHAKVDLIFLAVISQQKNACAAAGITVEILRDKYLAGELNSLIESGFRFDHVILKAMPGLKKRIKTRRKNIAKS